MIIYVWMSLFDLSLSVSWVLYNKPHLLLYYGFHITKQFNSNLCVYVYMCVYLYLCIEITSSGSVKGVNIVFGIRILNMFTYSYVTDIHSYLNLTLHLYVSICIAMDIKLAQNPFIV